jgi:hypothetical protein
MSTHGTFRTSQVRQILCSIQPALFEKQLTQTIVAIGSAFSPANATEFLDEVLKTRPAFSC